MLRYETVVHERGTINYKIPHTHKGKRVVDDTNFVPESEILKKLDSSRPLSDVELNQYYDLTTGKDTGIKVPFERSAENLDIAILAKDIRNKQDLILQDITQQKEKTERKLARQTELQKTLQSKE